MTNDPAVSVIVPVLNAEPTLPALLGALRGQLPNALGDAELLIVDNGSTDNSRRLVEGSGLPNLRALQEARPGPAAARNRGLAEARGEVVALLDADCVPTRGWLRTLVEPFRDETVVIVAGGLASYPPRTGAQRFAARYGLNVATRAVNSSALPFANTRNMAVRRVAAEAVGGWPADLTHGEDVEFSYLIRTRFGCPIVFQETALAFHQDRESDDDLIRQAYAYGRGTAILYRRHPEEVRWSLGLRMHRRRRSAQRRISARLARLGARFGRVRPEDAEFATYLALWDRTFWRGFFESWRESASR